ncbi:MAG: hypothetical protein HY927_00090 [Elusimicrobia bacterium]|nr:hypothetical protein [Elusimicrobiota bacterium]
MRIAIATCRKPPEPDPDQGPLLAALREAGARAEMVAWDDPSVDYARFDLCVIRSTWNYVHRLDAYLAWAKRVAAATRLLNPYGVVRWNTDKSYLKKLSARGVATVPTAFLGRGSTASLRAVASRRGWTDVVVKPRVGAASFSTRRFRAPAFGAGDEFLARRLAGRDMMVQPYLRSVEGRGERAIVWIAGELTHAVRKTPRFSGGHEASSPGLRIPPEERAFALRVLEPYAQDLLYARVDLARGDDGSLMLMELELVEPSLFLLQEPRALRRLVRGCLGRAS